MVKSNDLSKYFQMDQLHSSSFLRRLCFHNHLFMFANKTISYFQLFAISFHIAISLRLKQFAQRNQSYEESEINNLLFNILILKRLAGHSLFSLPFHLINKQQNRLQKSQILWKWFIILQFISSRKLLAYFL